MDDELDNDAIELTVAAGQDPPGLRLDQFLAQQLPQLSRSRIQKLIDEGHVTVDLKECKSKLKLKGGEQIALKMPPICELELAAEEIPLDIIYQDQNLAVINKPAGMVTHPGAGTVSGTLVNALLHHMRHSLSGISGVARPGIVHRLDKDTSGLLVIAKDDHSHRHLSEQIRAKSARRTYFALVEGVVKPEAATIDKPIGRHPSRRQQMAVVAGGREALSRFTVVQRFSKYTLVKVELQTGRTHQIRVHMASLGYPVAGDLVYNSKASGNESWRRKHGLLGHALHAFQLTFTHPVTGRLLEFEAPLPPDFRALIDALK